MKRAACFLRLFAAFTILAISAFSQTAQITVTVTDPSGAVVVGAKVTTTNPETGRARDFGTPFKRPRSNRSCSAESGHSDSGRLRWSKRVMGELLLERRFGQCEFRPGRRSRPGSRADECTLLCASGRCDAGISYPDQYL